MTTAECHGDVSGERDLELHFYGHDLRVRFGEFIDVLECLSCGLRNWHRWTPFTGGTWVGPCPDFDFFAGEHHRPEIISDVAVVCDVLTHVGARSEDVATYELLVGLRAEKVTAADLFDFLTGSRRDPEPGEHRGSA